MNNKRIIGLDTVAIIILALIFHFQSYEPARITYFLFLFFALIVVFVSVFIDLKFFKNSKNDKYFHYLKLIVIIVFITFTVGVLTISQISLRPKGVYIHDGAVEVEESIKFLLKGKNFYTEDYYNTPMMKYDRLQTFDGALENPALKHFVYLPFITLSSVPVYLFTENFFHWYDQRIVYIIFFVLTLFILYKIPKELENKRLLLVLFALNPFNYNFLAGGFNDIFVFFWIVLTIYLLKNRQFIWSSLALGPAVTSKQMAWFFVPFYIVYLYYFFKSLSPENSFIKNMKLICQKTYPFIIIVFLIFIPFLVWDWHSFIEDTVAYPGGSVYPINGYGFGFIVRMTGLVKSVTDYFPFWIFQLVICLPLFCWLIRWQEKDNRLSRLVIGYSLFITVWWFFSRFFHDNYVNYALMFLVIAYFLVNTEYEKNTHSA